MTENPDRVSVELLACPFCGGGGKSVVQKWSGREYHGVSCDGDCLTFFDCRAATDAEAIAAWNTRAAPRPIGEAVAWTSVAEIAVLGGGGAGTMWATQHTRDSVPLYAAPPAPSGEGFSPSSLKGEDTHRDAVKPVIAFGHGRFVVDTGSYNQTPAVFICPVDQPGKVGASARSLGHYRHTLLPGEMVLTFPFFQQAQAVADALVTAPPPPVASVSPGTSDASEPKTTAPSADSGGELREKAIAVLQRHLPNLDAAVTPSMIRRIRREGAWNHVK